MDSGKILLVNLSKGRTGELNSKLLGMIFVMKFQAAAMSRASIPEEDRKDFSLYVDEFQNFSTDSFATILSEARKYHLNLIVANQFTTQLTDEIRDAVFGNIGTVISYRVGTNDAEFLAKQFAPTFDIDNLQRIPNYNGVVRMLIGGVPAQPFSMATVPRLGKPNAKLMEALKQLSAAKYGRPKAQVEAEIFKRLRPIEEARPAFAQPNFGAASRLPGGAAAPARYPSVTGSPSARPAGLPVATRPPASGSSFLDDWLAKRGASAPAPAVTPAIAPTPMAAPAYTPPLTPYPTPSPAVSPLSSTPKPAAKPVTASKEPSLTPISASPPAATVPLTAAPKPKLAPLAVHQAPKIEPPKPEPAPSVLNFKKTAPAADQASPDDTISIDQEGTLHVSHEDDKRVKNPPKPVS
jgi:hypothetical protein